MSRPMLEERRLLRPLPLPLCLLLAALLVGVKVLLTLGMVANVVVVLDALDGGLAELVAAGGKLRGRLERPRHGARRVAARALVGHCSTKSFPRRRLAHTPSL